MAERKAKPSTIDNKAKVRRRAGTSIRDAEAVLRFVRQLAVKLKAGLSVEKCLAALANETRHRQLARACVAMSASLAGGTSLWQAMRSHGELFDPCVVGLVASGERSRKLRVQLGQAADYLEYRIRLAKGLRGAIVQPLEALFYVLLATFVATVALSFLVKDALPVLAGTNHPGVSLLDHVAFHVSAAVRIAWPIVGVCGLLGFSAVRLLPRRPAAREWFEAAALRVPLIGRAFRATGYAILTKTVGIWMQAGNTLAQAMEMALLTAHSWPMRQRIAATMQRIESGRPYVDAFVEDGILRMGDVSAVQGAERRGELGQLMLTLASDRQREAEIDVKSLRAISHSAVVLLLGIAILSVVLTLYVPVFVTR